MIAPHSETTALAACRSADLVLCPCRPSLADIRALTHTVDLVNLAKAKGVVVLNAIPTAGLKIDAQNALKSIGFPFVQSQLDSASLLITRSQQDRA